MTLHQLATHYGGTPAQHAGIPADFEVASLTVNMRALAVGARAQQRTFDEINQGV